MRPSSLSRREFLRETTAAALATSTLARAAQAAAGSPWQIGCYTRPFDQHDYRTALDAIAEAGYQYCGIMTAKGKSWVTITVNTTPEEAAQIGAEVRQRRLRALSVYGGDFPVAQSIEAGIAGLKRLIENCAACGASNLLLGGVGNEKLYSPYFKVVAECCPYAADKGIGLSLKPHGGANATGAQCRKATELVGHASFRVWYDPGNIYYYSDGKLDPVDDCGAVDGLVAGISVKDFLPPKEVMVTPGTGKVDFQKVFARLKRGGFVRGPLIVECLKRGELKPTIEEARKAREFLGRLVAD